MYDGGALIVAVKSGVIIGFAWSFAREIPAPVGKTEYFINVIEVFDADQRRKGTENLIVQKCIEAAKEIGCYRVRAYCDIRNTASHMLWVKNGFTVSPIELNDRFVGSYVAYKI